MSICNKTSLMAVIWHIKDINVTISHVDFFYRIYKSF